MANSIDTMILGEKNGKPQSLNMINMFQTTQIREKVVAIDHICVWLWSLGIVWHL